MTGPSSVSALRSHKLWRGHPKRTEGIFSGVIAPALLTPSVEQVRALGLCYPRGTSCNVDLFHPRCLDVLSNDCLGLLIELFLLVEASGLPPEPLALVLIDLIPKRHGGRRPIGMLCTFLRWPGRLRRPLIRKWEIAIGVEAPFCAGHTGRSPVDVAWAQSVRAEAALWDSGADLFVGAWIWELLKAYEHVEHSRVVTEAFEDARVPFGAFRMALNIYRMARRLVI